MSSAPSRTKTALRWGGVLLVVVALVVVARLLPVAAWVEELEGWVEENGALGVVGFGLAYWVAAVAFVPGAAITLAAGAVFGLGLGFVVVSVSSTLAAATAFLLARTLARSKVERLASKYPRFGAVDEAIARGGWKVVALLRLSPAIPYSASNYLYGLTRVRFVPYVLASWVAMMPGTFLYVYLGYAGRAGLAAVGEGEPPQESVWKTALLVVGLLATVAVTVYVTRLARKALKEQESELAGSDREELAS